MDGILTRRNHGRKARGGLARNLACSLGALFVVMAVNAGAAPAKVALVRESTPGALAQKTLTRLRAELVAAGFEVTDIDQHGGDGREAAEAEPTVEGVFATVAIVPRTGDAADIWVADRVTGKTVVRRIQASGTGRDVASILAVRAVELLQASLLEAVEPPPREAPVETSAPPPSATVPLPSDVSRWMAARRTTVEPRFALAAGLGVLHSFSGIGPAFLPVLGLSYRLTPELSLGFRAGGPAFAADLPSRGGTIAVRQEFAALEVAYGFGTPGAAVRPLGIAGVGVYHLDVVGAASPGYQGESSDLFAASLSFGPGANFRLGERVSILADVRLFFIAPQPIVRAAQESAGSMSRPSLFGEALVEVAF